MLDIALDNVSDIDERGGTSGPDVGTATAARRRC